MSTKHWKLICVCMYARRFVSISMHSSAIERHKLASMTGLLLSHFPKLNHEEMPYGRVLAGLVTGESTYKCAEEFKRGGDAERGCLFGCCVIRLVFSCQDEYRPRRGGLGGRMTVYVNLAYVILPPAEPRLRLHLSPSTSLSPSFFP